MNTRLGWDTAGRPLPINQTIDQIIAHLQTADDAGKPADPDTIGGIYNYDQLNQQSGLVVLSGCAVDGAVLRRAGAAGRTWACVAGPGDGLLTLSDVALMIGMNSNTLSAYVVRHVPVGNRFPEAAQWVGLSGPRPIRLWERWPVLNWHDSRTGRGYRSDRSALR